RNFKKRLVSERTVGSIAKIIRHRQDEQDFPGYSKWPVIGPSSSNPEQSCSSCLCSFYFAHALMYRRGSAKRASFRAFFSYDATPTPFPHSFPTPPIK